MDLARKTQYFTLDVITKIAFGEPFGNIEHDRDTHRYLQSTEEMMVPVILLGSVPLFRWLITFEWIAKLAFPTGKEAVGMGKILG